MVVCLSFFLKWTFYADFRLLIFCSWTLLDLHDSQFKKLLIYLILCLGCSTSIPSLSEASCLSFSPFSPILPVSQLFLKLQDRVVRFR